MLYHHVMLLLLHGINAILARFSLENPPILEVPILSPTNAEHSADMKGSKRAHEARYLYIDHTCSNVYVGVWVGNASDPRGTRVYQIDPSPPVR